MAQYKGTPNKSGGPVNANEAVRRAKRRKQVRRNRIIGVIVLLLVLALLVFSIVKLVGFFSGAGTVAPSTSVVTSVASEVPQEGTSVVEPAVNTAQYNYYEADIPVLLNRYNALPDELLANVEVVEVGVRPDTGEMHYLTPNAAAAFLDMVEAAAADGITLYPVSGYRSHERQLSNYNNSVANYVNQGYSQEQAEALTQMLIAIPGTSEHEAGLAIDINSLEQSFENTEEFVWLQENCNRFGFILRYEKTTYATTGIDYEPWHYRYVGDNHAFAIAELGVTLEEYVEMLQNDSNQAAQSNSAASVEEPLG